MRVDYWLLDQTMMDNHWLQPMIGKSLLEETMARQPASALTLRSCRWDALDIGKTPIDPDVIQAVAGMTQVDALDIGYREHEQSHDRTVFTRLPATRISPFAIVNQMGDHSLLEVGEAVIGSETFTLSTQPGKPLRLVMRTLPRVEAMVAGTDGVQRYHVYRLANPLRMRVQVGDLQTGIMEFTLTPETNRFDEILIEIPAGLITHELSRVTLAGDHISCAFWAYQ
jgi:hypothetical protein